MDNVLVSTDEGHSKEVVTKYWIPKAEAEKAEHKQAQADANKHQHIKYWREFLSMADPYLIAYLPRESLPSHLSPPTPLPPLFSFL